MIEKIDINGKQADVTEDLRKYVTKKIAKLDRYMPKHARPSAHAEVRLKESTSKSKKQCTCEVTLYLPHETLNVKETTLNMFAAVDIVEAKLRNQIKKYKETHGTLGLHRRIVRRFHRRAAPVE